MASFDQDQCVAFPAEFDVEFRQTHAGLRVSDLSSPEHTVLIHNPGTNIASFLEPCIPLACFTGCVAALQSSLDKQVHSSSRIEPPSSVIVPSQDGQFSTRLQFIPHHNSGHAAAVPSTTWSPVGRANITVLHAAPGIAFDRRIQRLVALKRLLLHTNAAISTLGGGHFLCGHLDDAAAMARRQLAVARALGDDVLFARVYMHYVYINLHSGNLDDALHIALRLRRHAKRSRDSELYGMATAAAVLIRRLLSIDHDTLPEAAAEVHAHDGAVVTKASDDFARYRSALKQRRTVGKGPRPV